MSLLVLQMGNSEPVKVRLGGSSTAHHDLDALAFSLNRRQDLVLDETDSLKDSKTSASLSFGRALDTPSLWRQETPVAANLALRVLQAMRKGDMNCGRREMSVQD